MSFSPESPFIRRALPLAGGLVALGIARGLADRQSSHSVDLKSIQATIAPLERSQALSNNYFNNTLGLSVDQPQPDGPIRIQAADQDTIYTATIGEKDKKTIPFIKTGTAATTITSLSANLNGYEIVTGENNNTATFTDIFTSLNSGKTWHQVQIPLPRNYKLTDVASATINPSNPEQAVVVENVSPKATSINLLDMKTDRVVSQTFIRTPVFYSETTDKTTINTFSFQPTSNKAIGVLTVDTVNTQTDRIQTAKTFPIQNTSDTKVYVTSNPKTAYEVEQYTDSLTRQDNLKRIDLQTGKITPISTAFIKDHLMQLAPKQTWLQKLSKFKNHPFGSPKDTVNANMTSPDPNQIVLQINSLQTEGNVAIADGSFDNPQTNQQIFIATWKDGENPNANSSASKVYIIQNVGSIFDVKRVTIDGAEAFIFSVQNGGIASIFPAEADKLGRVNINFLNEGLPVEQQ